MTRLWGTYQLWLALLVALVALVALGGSTLVYKDTDKVLWALRATNLPHDPVSHWPSPRSVSLFIH